MGDKCPIRGGIAEFGKLNVGTMKTVYRRGLGHRYGCAMQAISGVHFNYLLQDPVWPALADLLESHDSGQDFRSDSYFAPLRNCRRPGRFQAAARRRPARRPSSPSPSNPSVPGSGTLAATLAPLGVPRPNRTRAERSLLDGPVIEKVPDVALAWSWKPTHSLSPSSGSARSAITAAPYVFQNDEDRDHALPDGKPVKLALVVRRPLAALEAEESRSSCAQSLAVGSSALIALAVGLLFPSVMHADRTAEGESQTLDRDRGAGGQKRWSKGSSRPRPGRDPAPAAPQPKQQPCSCLIYPEK